MPYYTRVLPPMRNQKQAKVCFTTKNLRILRYIFTYSTQNIMKCSYKKLCEFYDILSV